MATEETEGEVRLRHARERDALQQELQAIMAAAGGKKASKKARKTARKRQEEARKALEERHAQELKPFEAGGDFLEQLAELTVEEEEAAEKRKREEEARSAGTNTKQQGDAPKKSKAQQRRERRAAREAERQAEIRREVEEETKGMADPRAEELAVLQSLLEPAGLALHEVRSDGHCLYRAIEHQLEGAHTVQELRKMAADYIRANPDRFAPFLQLEEEGADGLEAYCEAITAEAPVAWGGQPEVVALAEVLGRRISVFSADMGELLVGEDVIVADESPLRLSFHRHYFGLGDHYNSVVPKSDP